MATRKYTFGRRDFLKKTAQATVAAAVSAGFASTALPDDKEAEAIPLRTLGKTGLRVPILGFGGASLPTRWLNPLSREDRVALLHYAYDRGIRYFDTANNYLESQAIIGEAMKDRREKVTLVTKLEVIQPENVRKSVERSLKELQTDHIDILLIHGTPGLEQMSVEQAMKIHAEQLKLRDEKIIRFIGFSSHGYFDKALSLINSGGFDLCMLACGFVPRGHNQVFTPRMIKLRDDCLAKAHELGMGIVAMKVMGAGWLGAWSGYVVPSFDKQRIAQLPSAAIRYVLQDERVHVLNIGMRLRKEIDANIKLISAPAHFTPEDRALLTEFSGPLAESNAYKKMRVE